MSQHRLSKSRILSGLQCQKRLYLQVHQPDLAQESASAKQSFSMGHQLGAVAQDLNPGGMLIGHDDNLNEAVKETRELLANKAAEILFEATFEHKGVLIRADILKKVGKSYKMIEVKSSGSVKDYYLNDCAVQSWVIEGAGYPLKQVEVAHVDTSFIYPGNLNYQGLLHHEDITEQIRPLIDQVPVWVAEFQKMLAGSEPDIGVGEHCSTPFDCPFMSHCAPEQTEYPVTALPYGGSVAKELLEEGIADIRDIPEGRLSKANHIRVRRATISGQPELDAEAGDALRSLPYPRYYLDFETISYVVPIWIGTRPYSQLPFQWSCHIEDATGQMQHKEFLDTSGAAPMRAFAESMLAALGDQGPIIVYSGFESARIKELASLFPDLADDLLNIVDRLVDLLPIARSHYYHPAMKGKWSIKSVLPTIAPELNYKNLEDVQDGGMAQMAYLEITNPSTPAERREKLTKSLIEYCKLDTLAMVKVARFFEDRK